MAQKLGDKVVARAAGLDGGIDRQPRAKPAAHLVFILLRLHGEIAQRLRRQKQHGKADHHAGKSPHGQPHAVQKHHPQVQHTAEQIEDRAEIIAGQVGVDGAVALLAPGKLTGVALLKKREGQAQNVPDEAVAGQDIQLEAQAQKQRGLQKADQQIRDIDHRHCDHNGHKPVSVVCRHHIVHQNPRQDRQREAGDERHKIQDEQIAEYAPFPLEALPGHLKQAVPFSLFFEKRPRLKAKHDPGEGGVQLLHGHAAVPLGGIVEDGLSAAKALQHHEMVIVPVQDAGQGRLFELLRLAAKAAADEAEAPPGPQDAACRAAVARHAAGLPQFFHRQKAAVISKHHGKACRPAFRGLHLEGLRRADAPAPFPPGHDDAAPDRCAVFLSVHHFSNSLSCGRPSSMGWADSSTMVS